MTTFGERDRLQIQTEADQACMLRYRISQQPDETLCSEKEIHFRRRGKLTSRDRDGKVVSERHSMGGDYI